MSISRTAPLPALRRMLAAGVLAVMLSIVVADVVRAAPPPPPSAMSRNLYLGASLDRALQVISTPSGNTQFDQFRLARAIYDIYGDVQLTNYNVRVEALANEIQRHQPLVIGLQEAARWCVQAPSFGTTANCDDTGGTITYDLQNQLLAELASRGLNYTLAVSQEEADIEGTAINAAATIAFDVQLTQRDAILVRTGAASVVATDKRQYAINAPFGPFVSKRGWVSADLKIGKATFRAVNTHLEAFSPGVRDAQAAELVGALGPLNTSLPVVMTGDFNAETGTNTINSVLGAGFGDVAAIAGNPQPTCCHTELVNNPATVFGSRIDYVFTRPAVPAKAAWVEVTGDDPSEMVGGLWASDHGGVVASIVPPGQAK